MPSHVKAKKSYTDFERWVGLPHFMLKCDAWRALPPNGKAILIEIWRRYDGKNNGEISYSVREAKEIGIGKNAASDALNQLLELGFLLVTRNSLFTLKTKQARLWHIVALPGSDGRMRPRDFMDWRPVKRQTVIALVREGQTAAPPSPTTRNQ